MSDAQRVYSDEEFALILRHAADLARQMEPEVPSSPGLTLIEMKAIAAQVGIDPALVERASRTLSPAASESPLERLIGGPLRYEEEYSFPVSLDESISARLLSAVRINAALAGSQDSGHSSAIGITWHDGGPLEALSVTARAAGKSTSVAIALDRRGTLAVVSFLSGMGIFFSLLFAGAALYPEDPALGYVGAIASIGGGFAAVRAFWSSSTGKVRARIGAVRNVLEGSLTPVYQLPPGEAPANAGAGDILPRALPLS